MKSVDFITNIAPHYREHLWLELLKFKDYRIKFFFGDEANSSIQQINFHGAPWLEYFDRLVWLTNFRIRRVLVWQRGVVANAAKTSSSIVIFLGDMYLISTWIAVLILRIRRRRIVFWGHGIYGSETGIKKFLRLSFLRLADFNLVYSMRAKQLLVNDGLPETRIGVIFNSLDYLVQTSLRQPVLADNFYHDTNWFRWGDLPVLIYIGRLTKQKRLEKLLRVVNALNADGPRFNLLLIGDGPERQHLESLVSLDARMIHFYGACYREDQLAKLIANADLCVSPGEIGLTAIHSLSYGTPACTHGNFSKQMPEVEAIVEGITGTLFDESTGNLQQCIEDWFGNSHDRGEVRTACYHMIDDKYNPAVQCRVLREALDCL